MSSKISGVSRLAVGALALVSACTQAETKAAPKSVAAPAKAAPAPATNPAAAAEVDSTLAEQVRKAILADATLSEQAKAVSVSVHDGTVTLRGTVSDEVEKSNLTALASNILGVRRVDNQLEVKAG